MRRTGVRATCARAILPPHAGRLLLPLLVLTACDASVIPPLPASEVYEFRLDTQPPLVARWPAGSVIRIHVVDAGAAGAAPLRDALADGMTAWNRHALSDEYTLVAADDAASADVLLAWSDATLPVDTDACPPSGGRATTTFCVEDGRLFRFPLTGGGGSSVTMLVTVASLLASAPAVLDATVTHELGHVLGIMRHSDQTDDLMWAGDLSRDEPSSRDVATVKALYRTRADVYP